MKNIMKIISVVMACLILAGVFATSSFAAGYIGKDKAKEIALNHAGVTADKVSFMKCEFDRDDGIAVYDVEFYFDRCEYDYEINAKNSRLRMTPSALISRLPIRSTSQRQRLKQSLLSTQA